MRLIEPLRFSAFAVALAAALALAQAPAVPAQAAAARTWQRYPEARDHLERTGRMVAGATRRARAATCRGCGAKVLDGLDADVCALVATVDPTPLTAIGEVLAVLDGRRTFTLAV